MAHYDCNGTLVIKHVPTLMYIQATEIAEKQWYAMTGGCAETVTELSRNKCIELCMKGYHSPDLAQRDKLKSALEDVGNFHFDLIDTDHDG